MASWAEVVLPVQMAGEPRHATGPLRAPETRGFRPTTRAPVEGPLQVDRRLVRPFLHSQSAVNRCHDQAGSVSRSHLLSSIRGNRYTNAK